MRTAGILRALLGAVGIMAGLLMFSTNVYAGTIYDSPYVTFAPDGRAWTTDAGDQAAESYTGRVVTGAGSSLPELQTGEHYYRYKRSGTVTVSRWEVELSHVTCCHTDHPNGAYHGIGYGTDPCFRLHFSGWVAYCADCGEMVSRNLYYMSRGAVSSLAYLEMGTGLDYYYLCPFCDNLEMGTEQGAHLCKKVSANRYLVQYLPNTDGTYGGYMQPSLHMYNNSTEYEGQETAPQTHLSRNSYTRIGWEFVGWNTRADGSGTDYADEAEILNLTDQNYQAGGDEGIVTLYAMWRRSGSTLELDPAGGAWDGGSDILSLYGEYGETRNLSEWMPNAPEGCTVSFETNGGEAVSPITGTTHFTEWTIQGDFQGKLEGDEYLYCAPDGHTDRLRAAYERDAIILPDASGNNLSFGGWYADPGCTIPVGEAGDTYVPIEDVTLYAKWVELRLFAAENYEVLDGTGAVDLTWSQPDGNDKTYKVYQKREGSVWKQVGAASEIAEKLTVTETFAHTGEMVSYSVPHTGFYTLSAGGAQGADYDSYSGGAGGEVSGKFWLEKGEILSVTAGGQDGYNGGGTASQYGNGGGYTEIKSDRQGALLIAGGGGGATGNGNGYAGGSEQGLVTTGGSAGESGAAGGGGGAIGGRAGELIRHYHTNGVCNHIHSGSSSRYGGCYTKAVYCGRSLTAECTGRLHWYWGGTDEIYCPACGADATKGETCTGHYTSYYDHICPVHGNRESNTSSRRPSTCTAVASYAPACGKTTAYTCGYPYDGYIVSSKPAYGGSSYINETAAYSYASSVGGNEGNGYARLESVDVGYLAETELNGTAARDMAAPEAVSSESVVKEASGSDAILVRWDAPRDQGTLYYHQVESYQAGTDNRLLVSNITGTTLTSGIKGYYCWMDETETSEKPDAADFLTETRVKIVLLEHAQYLHICPVDRAGNEGAVLDIAIGSLTGDPDVAWPLYTEPISIAEGGNVCAAETDRTWYVRSDGSTEFELSFSAYVDGIATADYQPEELLYAVLENGETGRLGAKIPKAEIGEATTYLSGQMGFFEENGAALQSGSYGKAARSGDRREAELVRRFYTLPEADGQTLVVYPRARAYLGEVQVVSDEESDLGNAITLILDGQGPEITGCEALEDLVLLDRRDGEVALEIRAADVLSGVDEFYLEIYNADNGSRQQYLPDADGCIRVTITGDLPIFSGDLEFTVYASDRVGNETTLSYGTTEFDLQTEIVRILEPHEPQFKRGESGVLSITTWGYVEKLEIIFPEELSRLDPELNHTYVYNVPDNYRMEETFQFMVPLGTPTDTTYTVTVRAYKGDRMMEQHPAFDVLDVSGTVLDDIRTRLR